MANTPESMTLEQLQALIVRETDHLELKTGAGVNPLQESMVAFSNTEGGTIIIGVDDDRNVVGRRLDQATDDRIHEAARNAHSIGRFSVSQVEVDGKPVVFVRVSRRQEGYAQTSNGRVLVRSGGHNVHLYGDDLWQFLSARRFGRFEATSSGIHFSEARDAMLREVCGAFGWDPGDPNLVDRLRERGMADADGILTIAGALVLTDPSQSLDLQKAQVEIRRYPDESADYDRRVYVGGPITSQVTDATQFVVDELGTDLVVTGVHRYELPKLPPVVVREAVANALAHRSYEHDRVNVLIEMRPNRIIIRSPGRLPEPVTIETMRSAQAARNPTVIDVLRRLRLAEDAGRGVDVMEDSMAEALLNPPLFAEDGESVVVTLPLVGPITARERAWVADLESRGELEAHDRMLVIHAARGERLTNAVAREILNTDALKARATLRRLRDAGFLVQHGDRGGANYTIAESLAPAARYRLSPDEMQNLVVEAAHRSPLSNQDVRELTGLDRDEALALLRRLVAAGRLSVSGARRGTRYSAPEL